MHKAETMSSIHGLDAAAVDELLRLNNEHAEALSLLDERQFRTIATDAFFARSIGSSAFIFALDQNAPYGSPNFLWFRERLPRFVYVDRVVVAAEARGRGYARRLYDALFEAAANLGHDRVVCEINVQPPNPASDAFHHSLGFAEVGRAELPGGAKTVRYLERRL